jgi:5'-nucleotidase
MSASGLRRRTPVAAAAGFAVVLALGISAAPSSAAPKPKAKPVPVQLLSFNDYHGHIEPDSGSDAAVALPGGGSAVTNGAAYLATHLAQLRAGHQNTITAAAGDLIGGSTFTSGVFHDEPSVETLNAMHLDVSSVGNHEFDEGVTELLRMQYGGCHPVDGCFQQDAAGVDIPYPGASFPWLAANVVNTTSGKTVLPPTWIKTVQGAKIGFIGMTLEGTNTLVSPDGIEGYEFQDEIIAGNRAAAQLQGKGVQSIVVLLHEGGAQTGTYNECVGMSGPIMAIAQGLAPSIDALITGHTHQAYNCTIPDPAGQPRKVVSAMSFGRIITEMNFTVDKTTGDVIRSSVTAVNHLVTRDVAADPVLKGIVDKWAAKSAVQGDQRVGTISTDIKRAFTAAGTENRAAESSLSNLIADAQLESTQNNGSQIALMNPGGVRTDLNYASSARGEGDGVVTYREAFNVQPFSNILQTITLTGDQIYQALEQQWPTAGRATTLRLGLSNGFTYQWRAAPAAGESRVVAGSAALNGVPLSTTGTYRVTVNNFLAAGGDGFTAFRGGTNVSGGKVDLDAFVDYLGAHSPVAPAPVARSTQLP